MYFIYKRAPTSPSFHTASTFQHMDFHLISSTSIVRSFHTTHSQRLPSTSTTFLSPLIPMKYLHALSRKPRRFHGGFNILQFQLLTFLRSHRTLSTILNTYANPTPTCNTNRNSNPNQRTASWLMCFGITRRFSGRFGPRSASARYTRSQSIEKKCDRSVRWSIIR